MQNKITILSTRELPITLLEKAAAKKIFIDNFSFIKTEIIHDDFLKKRIQHYADHQNTIVFTSINAVEAIAKNLGNKKPDWKFFCIGNSTKTLVKKYFGETNIAGNADTASILADIILQKRNISSVIFFCGDKRIDELPKKLRSQNIEVNEIEVYKTIETPSVVSKKYEGILFYSPSAVTSFFSKNKIDNTTVLFAIGNTTADEIKKFTANKIFIADKPSKELLAEKAVEYFEENPIHH